MDNQKIFKRGYWAELRRSYSIVSLLMYGMLGSILLLVTDLMDYPSRYIYANGTMVGWLTVGGILLSLTLGLWNLGILSMFRVTSANSYDAFLFSVILCSALLLASYILLDVFGSSVPTQSYKAIGSAGALVGFLALLGVRIIKHIKRHKQVDKLPSTIFDLKDIANGNFNPIPGQPILVSEEAVDYDLLERGPYIDQLYNAITTCNPDSGFVISLEGSWGSGKTTILNNVKQHLKENINSHKPSRWREVDKAQKTNNVDVVPNAIVKPPDLILIDDFDPWTYGDAEGMLYGFFDAILRETGVHVSMLVLRHLINEISTTLSSRYPLSKVFRSSVYSTSQSSRVKEWVNDYLVATNQKVIVFLDNIDRAESENVILLFKIIGNVFNLKRVIYVLSFDPGRVRDIFSDKLSIDYGFVKKIIQLPIQLPPIAQEKKAILITNSLVNMLVAYGEEEHNVSSYIALNRCMIQTIDDLREWKRFINAAFSRTFLNNFGLFPPDLLALSYIQFSCPELYQAIQTNRYFFVSHDRITNMDLYKASFKREQFNEASKAFFDNFFSKKYGGYKTLLEDLFPYVKRHEQGQEVQPGYGNPEESSDISANSRICSAKYFDLYFTLTSNDYLQIGEQVKDAITRINRANDQDTSDEIIHDLIKRTPYDQHKEMIERLQSHLDAVKSQMLLIVSLLKHMKEINNTSELFALNARSRSEFILATLLQRMPESDFSTFLETNKTNYAHIEVILSIIHWVENSKEEKNMERINPLQEMYKQMCQDVISIPVDLYNNQHYFSHNVRGVAACYKDDLPTIQQYIAKIANSSNIYRLLYDTVSVLIGNTIRYFISQEYWNALLVSTNVDDLIAQAPPHTESEEFLLKVYKVYKENPSANLMSDKGSIVVPAQIRIEV